MAEASFSLKPSNLLTLLALYWFPLSAIFTVAWLLRNKYQKNLASIPGPPAAAWTGLWRLFRVYKGRFHEEQIQHHRKYGKLVRIAPHVVSVSDPEAIPIIYPLKQTFTKTGFYPIQSISWQKKPATNVFSTIDPAKHRDDKRKVSSAYSMSNLLKSEPAVDSCTELFFSKLDESASASKPIDLGEWLQYYAFDVVGEMTFAKKLGFLDGGQDVDGMMEAIQGMLAYAALCGQVPVAHHFLLGNPVFAKLMPAMETWNQVLVFTLKAMNSRTKLKRDEELASSEEAEGIDMLSRWRAVHSSDPLKMSTKDVVVALSTNVFAGSDTTAIALRAVIYYLCHNPDKMRKTVEEIDKADREGKLSKPISYKESDTHLPYFACVLNEAMRLHPSVGLIMERNVPPEGVEICGKYIAGGAIVGINPWVLNYDPKIFPDPESFIPERWLEEGEEARERENILMFNFGAGARACIGKNISMMEMHKILPELLRQYTIELTHPEKDWRICNYWFVQQSDLICNLTRRKK